MAHFVATNAYLSVNGVVLSDHVESLSWPITTDSPEDTSMGDTARTYLVGLKDSTLTVNFRSDFAASDVYATLSGVYSGGAAVAVAVRAVNTTISATNPELQASAILTSWDPMALSIGDVSNTPATFQISGDITFDVTP
jgi:hypothetical protein